MLLLLIFAQAAPVTTPSTGSPIGDVLLMLAPILLPAIAALVHDWLDKRKKLRAANAEVASEKAGSLSLIQGAEVAAEAGAGAAIDGAVELAQELLARKARGEAITPDVVKAAARAKLGATVPRVIKSGLAAVQDLKGTREMLAARIEEATSGPSMEQVAERATKALDPAELQRRLASAGGAGGAA